MDRLEMQMEIALIAAENGIAEFFNSLAAAEPDIQQQLLNGRLSLADRADDLIDYVADLKIEMQRILTE